MHSVVTVFQNQRMARDTRSLELTYQDLNGQTDSVIIDKYPDRCPVCENGIEAKFFGAWGKSYSDYGKGHLVQAVFRCPRLDCQTVFIAYYASFPGASYGSDNYVFLKNTFVRPYFKPEEFDEEIVTLSPDFVAIYTQAKIAEEMGLDLICGPGYRKALEFLIKDFLIKTKSKNVDYVKNHGLGWLIANDIDSEKIKITSGLAKDLGNDETHYEKKIEKLTIEDMKKLIKLTSHWITDEILTEGYKGKLTKNDK